jgi:aspartyl-tRNA(Asn)/glutamyl-tRNA(Gln) amidotransferase subunit A
MNDVFTVPASLAGIPAISIPAEVPSSNGAPPFAGIQILAQFSDDARLLQIARLTKAVLKKNEMSKWFENAPKSIRA